MKLQKKNPKSPKKENFIVTYIWKILQIQITIMQIEFVKILK